MVQKRKTFYFGLIAKVFKSHERVEPVGTTSSNNQNFVVTGASTPVDPACADVIQNYLIMTKRNVTKISLHVKNSHSHTNKFMVL